MSEIVAIFVGILVVGLVGILIFVAKRLWAEEIRSGVKHDYDQRMLNLEEKKETRLRSELAAELLAEWLKPEEDIDFHRLNTLSIQAFLWLPEELVLELNKVLTHASHEPDSVRKFLAELRKYLQQQDDELSGAKIVLWPKEEVRPYKQKP